MRYNAGIMRTSSVQLTIRGLDPATKSALVKKAAQKGLSLNKYAVATLQQAAGTDTSQIRYRAMKQFLSQHRISSADIKAANEAIAWMDQASKAKQQRDERDLNT